MQLFFLQKYQTKWGWAVQSIGTTGCSTAGYENQEISLKTARLAKIKNSLHIKFYLFLITNFFGRQLPIIALKEVCGQVSLSLLGSSTNSLSKVTQKGWTEPTSFKSYKTIYHLMKWTVVTPLFIFHWCYSCCSEVLVITFWKFPTVSFL